ncbi:MAG: RagB/SusD family nutrient uptake outer membrane protein [Flavobacteriaceae bacterium]|nr:RagB/SusD family nutrient uptake outer membrane protein [Flavobacteriaceae bacterium]
MKKIKFILIGLLISIGFTSCDDAIDIEQKGFVDLERSYQSVDDLNQGLNAVMGVWGNNAQISHNSIWTDEVKIGFANGGQGLGGTYLFLLNSGSGSASAIWNNKYLLINFCNRLLEAADVVRNNGNEYTQAELAEIRNIEAQLRGIRAFANLELLTYFSPDMTDPNAMGVLKLDFVPDIDDFLPRSPNSEIFEFIESDLEFARNNINNTDVFFINPRALTAIEARYRLFREEYDLAEDLAQELIDQVPLSQPNVYKQIWLDQADGETIFALRRVAGDNRVGRIWASVNSSRDGSPFYEMSRALFNTLDENDVRFEVMVHPTAVINPNYQDCSDEEYRECDILPINKHPGSEFNHLANLKMLRVSEMYFIKAEAQVHNNDLQGAAETLKMITDARYTSNAPGLQNFASQQQAWGAILDERRKELAYEGFRYIDLGRLGVKANRTVDRDPKDCEPFDACEIPNTDHRWVMPIPNTEFEANPAIEGQQNPGY